MKPYPFMQVDAFTDRPLGGNPCAILFDTDGMDEALMLAIAKEMNLSETAFVRRSDVADFGARYFTPAVEIPLAGHPTIATIFALIDSGRLTLTGDYTSVTLELPAGVIPIEIYASAGKVQRIVMSQNKPQFLATYRPADILPLFNLTEADILADVPLQTVSTGTPQLMVPLGSLEALQKIEMNIVAYKELRAKGDFFSPHFFCVQGISDAGQTFARHFGVPPDTLEDPFTGSATGGMAAYLWHYNLIDKPEFVAEQGHWMGRPGQATVEVIGPRDDITAIKVGGGAAAIVRGELSL
ncbi:MAG: PhzF family phenazine biosynthesis protein [Anaerolineae bacterium]|nr:PhzF family phenazine biosynthesis protein [Anaerolineae bacterium]